jgi:hypothetical protein
MKASTWVLVNCRFLADIWPVSRVTTAAAKQIPKPYDIFLAPLDVGFAGYTRPVPQGVLPCHVHPQLN